MGSSDNETRAMRRIAVSGGRGGKIEPLSRQRCFLESACTSDDRSARTAQLRISRRAAFHARRPDRHAGHGKTGRIRLLGKKPLERNSRNVALNDIARDFRGVAGGEIVRHAEPCLHRIEVRGVQDLGRKSGFLQVLHPAGTAAAIRVSVDRDERLRRCKSVAGRQQRRPRSASNTPRRVTCGSIFGMAEPPRSGTNSLIWMVNSWRRGLHSRNRHLTARPRKLLFLRRA